MEISETQKTEDRFDPKKIFLDFFIGLRVFPTHWSPFKSTVFK